MEPHRILARIPWAVLFGFANTLRRKWSTITSNNHPSNPQQPIHSLRLAEARVREISRSAKWLPIWWHFCNHCRPPAAHLSENSLGQVRSKNRRSKPSNSWENLPINGGFSGKIGLENSRNGFPRISLEVAIYELDTSRYQDLLRFEWEKWWPGIVKKWCNSEISYPMECSFPQITIVYMHVVLKGFYPTSWPLLPAYVMAPTRQGSAGLKPLGGSKRGPTLKSQEISLTKGLILLRSKFYSGNDKQTNDHHRKSIRAQRQFNLPRPKSTTTNGSAGFSTQSGRIRRICGQQEWTPSSIVLWFQSTMATMATMAPSVSKVSTPHSRGVPSRKNPQEEKNIAEFPHVAVVTMSHWQV